MATHAEDCELYRSPDLGECTCGVPEVHVARQHRALEAEVARLRVVASAAREYLMRSVPDPNVGTAAEDTLREALADLEMTEAEVQP